MGRRKRGITEAERALWRHAMRDVAPIEESAPDTSDQTSISQPVVSEPAAKPQSVKSREVPRAVPSLADLDTDLIGSLSKGWERPSTSVLHTVPPKTSGTVMPGIDQRTADRFRRGRMEIDGRIDLHGMTRDTAHRALNGFLFRMWDEGARVALVITGKGSMTGKAVLKEAVPRWLAMAPVKDKILAIRQAQPQHGGGGAYYVLLKRRRDRQ